MSTDFKIPPRKNTLKKHLPVAILIDKSGSAHDIRPLVERSVRKMIQKLQAEITFRGVVELLMIFFSGECQAAEFTPLEKMQPDAFSMPECTGTTNTGQALLYALGKLEKKRLEWEQSGERSFEPLMFLLTDGFPDAGIGAPEKVREAVKKSYQDAAQTVRKMEREGNLLFLAAGVQRKNGVCADMAKLQELSAFPDRIFRVDDSGGLDGVELFFHVIYEQTLTMTAGL